MLNWFKKKRPDDVASNVVTILLTMKVSGILDTFILLAKDGAVNRSDAGIMKIAQVDGTMFEKLRQEIGPEVVQLFGKTHAAEEIEGEPCEINFTFQNSDGSEMYTLVKCGSISPAPPLPIRQFGMKAQEITEEWYQNFKV